MEKHTEQPTPVQALPGDMIEKIKDMKKFLHANCYCALCCHINQLLTAFSTHFKSEKGSVTISEEKGAMGEARPILNGEELSLMMKMLRFALDNAPWGGPESNVVENVLLRWEKNRLQERDRLKRVGEG